MDDKLQDKLKGTTTIALVCPEGVVLGADMRSTMGYFVADKKSQKIWKIDDHLGVTIAGGVGDNQALIRLLQAEAALYKVQYKPIKVEAAATLLSNILNQMRYYPMMTQMIIAGYDDQPRVFDLDMVGGMVPKKYTSTGSGSPTAYGLLEAEYREDLPLSEGKRLLARALRTALERDAATGGGIAMATITKDGFKVLSQEEIQKLK